MSRLYAVLVRHGEYQQQNGAPSAHQPHPLTTRGEAQARQTGRELATWLQEEQWVLAPEIHCSTLLRAWQTADLMREPLSAQGYDAKLREFDALCERSVGALANLEAEQIAAVVARDPRYAPLPANWKSQADYRLPVPGAESLIQAGARVAAHIRQQMQALHSQGYEQCLQVFVGHGAAFRHAACELGVLKPADVPALSMFHAGAVCLAWQTDRDSWQHYRGEWKCRNRNESITD